MQSTILKISLFICSFAFLHCQQSKTENTDTAPRERPNILFIMTDDHIRQAMSAYDSELIQTPNLDRIAKDGILFKNSFVTNSICGPSRAVMLTGKYSHINGFKDNHQSTGWHHVPKHYGVRTNRYKLLHYYESGDWELYDLESDPQEMRNLYGKEAYIDLAVELKEEIVRLQEEYAVPKGT